MVFCDNTSSPSENKTIDHFYNLVLDNDEHYAAGNRAKWIFSDPREVFQISLGFIAVVANTILLISLSQVRTIFHPTLSWS